MAVDSYKMGPGTLKLGPAGIQNISGQVTEMSCVPSETVKTVDAIDTLDGSQIAKEDTPTIEWTLEGNVVQDIAAAGMVAYSWAQSMNNVAFEFIPATAAARKVTGTVCIVPIKIGGAVKTRNQSDIKWRIIGTPVLAATP